MSSSILICFPEETKQLKDIVIALNTDDLDKLVSHEKRMDELFNGVFVSQICTCYQNNPEALPPITL